MIKAIKTDRVLQVLILACLVVFCFIAVGAVYMANRLLSSPDVAPAAPPPAVPTVTPAPAPEPTIDEQQFQGDGNKVELFTIYESGPVFFSAVHRSTRQTKPFFVTLKDSSGETIKLLIAAQGNSENEAVENLQAGDYLLEITGDVWVISVLHNR